MKRLNNSEDQLSAEKSAETYRSQSLTIYIRILENLLAWAGENKKTSQPKADIEGTLQKLKEFNENKEIEKNVSPYSLFKTFINNHHSTIDQYCKWLSSLKNTSTSSTFKQAAKSVSHSVLTFAETSRFSIETTLLWTTSAEFLLPHKFLLRNNFPSYDQKKLSKINEKTIRKSEIKYFLTRVIDFERSRIENSSTSLIEEFESVRTLLLFIEKVNNFLEKAYRHWQLHKLTQNEAFLLSLKQQARQKGEITEDSLKNLKNTIQEYETKIKKVNPQIEIQTDRFSQNLEKTIADISKTNQKIALLALPKDVQTMLMIIYSYNDAAVGKKIYLANAIKSLPTLLLNHLINPHQSAKIDAGEGTSSDNSSRVSNSHRSEDYSLNSSSTGEGSSSGEFSRASSEQLKIDETDPLDFLYQKVAFYYAICNLANRMIQALNYSSEQRYLANFPEPDNYNSIENYLIALKSTTVLYTSIMVSCHLEKIENIINNLHIDNDEKFERFGMIIDRSIAQIPEKYRHHYRHACTILQKEINEQALSFKNKNSEDQIVDTTEDAKKHAPSKQDKTSSKTDLETSQKVLLQCLNNDFPSYKKSKIKEFLKDLTKNACSSLAKSSQSLIEILTTIQRCNAAYEYAKINSCISGKNFIARLKELNKTNHETTEKDENYYQRLLKNIQIAMDTFEKQEKAMGYGETYSNYQKNSGNFDYGKRFGRATQKAISEISSTTAAIESSDEVENEESLDEKASKENGEGKLDKNNKGKQKLEDNEEENYKSSKEEKQKDDAVKGKRKNETPGSSQGTKNSTGSFLSGLGSKITVFGNNIATKVPGLPKSEDIKSAKAQGKTANLNEQISTDDSSSSDSSDLGL